MHGGAGVAIPAGPSKGCCSGKCVVIGILVVGAVALCALPHVGIPALETLFEATDNVGIMLAEHFAYVMGGCSLFLAMVVYCLWGSKTPDKTALSAGAVKTAVNLQGNDAVADRFTFSASGKGDARSGMLGGPGAKTIQSHGKMSMHQISTADGPTAQSVPYPDYNQATDAWVITETVREKAGSDVSSRTSAASSTQLGSPSGHFLTPPAAQPAHPGRPGLAGPDLLSNFEAVPAPVTAHPKNTTKGLPKPQHGPDYKAPVLKYVVPPASASPPPPPSPTPVTAQSPPVPAAQYGTLNDPGWTEHIDPATGRSYYLNSSGILMHGDRPKGFGRRRLAALEVPHPSIAMDLLPVVLSFFFFIILCRIACVFNRRSKSESERVKTAVKENSKPIVIQMN